MHADLAHAVLLGSGVLLVALLAVRLADKTGVPALLLYLGLGMALGEDALGVRFQDYQLTEDIGLLLLAVILAEGGLTTRWSSLRRVVAPALSLATVGVAVSVGVVMAALTVLLGYDPRSALLLAAIVSSTDSAAVFAVLRRLPVVPRLRHTLEAESGLSDGPIVVLVTFAASDDWSTRSPLAAAGMIGLELVGGLLLGLLVGWLGSQLLARAALGAAGLYPLATVAVALVAFSGGQTLHVSGFVAVYVAGVVLGSSRLPHRRAVLGFTSSLGVLAEAGLFVLLGLLAVPHRLPGALLTALVVGAALTLVARPLSVLVATAPLRVPWREQAFLSWAGLRGGVPVVLATVPQVEGLPRADRYIDVVLVLVVVYTLAQAPSLPWFGRALGVVDRSAPVELPVEAAPLDELRADLLQVTVTTGSRLVGVHVDELRLPPEALVSLVVRDGRASTPQAGTRLRGGDVLLVLCAEGARAATEERLGDLARRGRLAGWV